MCKVGIIRVKKVQHKLFSVVKLIAAQEILGGFFQKFIREDMFKGGAKF